MAVGGAGDGGARHVAGACARGAGGGCSRAAAGGGEQGGGGPAAQGEGGRVRGAGPPRGGDRRLPGRDRRGSLSRPGGGTVPWRLPAVGRPHGGGREGPVIRRGAEPERPGDAQAAGSGVPVE